jgi:hypothetical protein
MATRRHVSSRESIVGVWQGCLNQLNQESIKSDFMIKSLIYSPHLTDLYNRSRAAPIEPHTNYMA